MMENPAPLRFEPVYKNYLWGGDRMHHLLDRPVAPGEVIAESWEIADHPDGMSHVAEGPLKGRSLGELTRTWPIGLLGEGAAPRRFPVLLKYLDAAAALSVQVHPDDDAAERLGVNDSGKTEAWYVVDTRPGSVLWAGLREGVDRREFESALRDGRVETLLHRIVPSVGDCVFLPAGTVHALGAGLMVVELQQTSNATFRLFDWNRRDADGKSRELHIESGLEAIDFDASPENPIVSRPTDLPGRDLLVDCPHFRLFRLSLPAEMTLETAGRCLLVTVPFGRVTMIDPDGRARVLTRGDTVLLPAAMPSVTLHPTVAAPSEVLVAQPKCGN
jgi:mannose-6-phosphate isomerase